MPGWPLGAPRWPLEVSVDEYFWMATQGSWIPTYDPSEIALGPFVFIWGP